MWISSTSAYNKPVATFTQDEILTVWQRASAALARQVNPDNYRIWIEGLAASAPTEGGARLTLAAPNHYFEEWVRTNYWSDILEAVRLSNDALDVELVVRKSAAAGKPAVVQTAPGSGSAVAASAVEDPRASAELLARFRFDNYVVGTNNKFAATIAEHVAKHPGVEYNPLYIHGGTGLGKTHLIQAIGNYVIEHLPQARVRYLSMQDLVSRLIQSFRHQDTQILERQLGTYDVLLVDDVQHIMGKDSSSKVFFAIFNTLYHAQKQIVLTSDVTPAELGQLDERIRSRFGAGLVAEITPPDVETRCKILRKKVEILLDRHPGAPVRSISDETLMYLAESINSNVRELEGALLQLNAQAAVQNAVIDVAFAERALSHLALGTRSLTGRQILAFVAKYFQTTESDLRSAARQRSIAEPRQLVMFLCKELTTMSFPDIGTLLNRDHSTVMHGYQKIRDRLAKDPVYRSNIDALKRAIRH